MYKNYGTMQSIMITLLNKLGYTESDWEIEKKLKIVHLNEEKTINFDFLISISNKPIFAIEIKTSSNNSDFTIERILQISDYAKMLNIQYLVFFDIENLKLYNLNKNEFVKTFQISEGLIDERTIEELSFISKENFLKEPEDISKIIWLIYDISRDNGLRYEELPFELIKVFYLKYLEDIREDKTHSNRFNKLNNSSLDNIKKNVSKLISNLKNENMNLFSFDDINLSKKTLLNVIKLLESFNLTKLGPDLLTESLFQYFTRGKLLGNFYTPTFIIKFLVNLANPDLDNKIIDITAGTGSILVGIKKYLERDLLVFDKSKTSIWPEKLFGIENNLSVSDIAKFNFYINDLPPRNLIAEDSLLYSLKIESDKFDIAIFHPPFGKIDLKTKEKYSYLQYQNLIGKNPDLEALFILKGLELLKEGGVLITILPESFFYSHRLNRFRQYLKNSHQISAIISLPAGIFSHTSIKSSILILIKRDEIIYPKEYDIFMAIIQNNEDFKDEKKINQILKKYKIFREGS